MEGLHIAIVDPVTDEEILGQFTDINGEFNFLVPRGMWLAEIPNAEHFNIKIPDKTEHRLIDFGRGGDELNIGTRILQLKTSIGNSQDPKLLIPENYNLSHNYPNPFNPNTKIEYSILESGHVTLIVYNLQGHQIRTLYNGDRTSGKYIVAWDGKDNNGNYVVSGVYLYQMRVLINGKIGFHKTRKFLLLK